MNRRLSLASLFMICLLASCGGGDGSSGGAPAPSTGSSPPPTVLIAGAPTLVLGIGGTSPGVDYDTLRVGGRATLGGNLQLRFMNGFRPTPGQSFVVVSATGGVAGAFGAVNAEGTPITIRYDSDRVIVTAS